jgi:chaperonin cofactor prefoldin
VSNLQNRLDALVTKRQKLEADLVEVRAQIKRIKGEISAEAHAPHVQEAEQRRHKAIELRKKGLTYDEIGQALGGLSRERVRQLIKRAERLGERHWHDGLSTRTANCVLNQISIGTRELEAMGSAAVAAEITKIPRDTWLEVSNMGWRSLAEMEKWIAQYGHKLT